MNIVPGQALLLQMTYADGQPCSYKRTFLVVDTDLVQNKVILLNVSSVAGKVRKVSFPSNRLISNYRPPFDKPSFVKLDSIYEIHYFSEIDNAVLHNGNPLDSGELTNIRTAFESYQRGNSVCFNVLV